MQDADPIADAACQCKVLAANFLTFPFNYASAQN